MTKRHDTPTPKPNPTAIPAPITAVAGDEWHCARCGGPVDSTRSLYIRQRPGQPAKIWHTQCPPKAAKQ